MNRFFDNIFPTVIMVFLITVGSCKSKDKQNLVWSEKFQNGSVEVYVFDQKKNAQSITQCNNYLEIKPNDNGFQMHGATIADVFGYLKNVNRNSIVLNDKSPVFYTVIYKGSLKEENYHGIITKLLALRNLTVDSARIDKKMFEINSFNEKLSGFRSRDQNRETFGIIQNDTAQLSNYTLKFFVRSLNENYDNQFRLSTTEEKELKYDFKYPANLDNKEIINYLADKYGFNFTTTQGVQTIYTIAKKKIN